MSLALDSFGYAHGPVGGLSREGGFQWSSCFQGQTAGDTLLRFSMFAYFSFLSHLPVTVDSSERATGHSTFNTCDRPTPTCCLNLPLPLLERSCWFSVGLASLPPQNLLMQATPPFSLHTEYLSIYLESFIYFTSIGQFSAFRFCICFVKLTPRYFIIWGFIPNCIF